MSAVTEGRPCVPFRPSSESISYKPFFGKYSTTGRGESENTTSEFERPERTRRAPRRSRGGAPGAGREERRLPPPSLPPPPPQRAPAPPAQPPAAGAPSAPQAGGAAP